MIIDLSNNDLNINISTEQQVDNILNNINKTNDESEYYYIQAKNNGIIDNYNNIKNDNIILTSVCIDVKKDDKIVLNKKYYNGSQINI